MRRTVEEFITRDLTAVTPEDTVRDVIALFSLRNIFGIPVVDKFNRVIGYISEKAITKSVFPERLDQENIIISLDRFSKIIKQTSDVGEDKVETIMNRNPITVTEDSLLADVIEIMLKKDLSSISVVRDDLLVGVVTRVDLCRFLLEGEGGNAIRTDF